MRIKTTFRALAFTLLLAAAGLPAGAADYVRVQGASGTAVYFALSEKPVVTFAADKLVLKTTTQTVEYPLTEQLSFTFENQATSIELVKSGAVFTVGASLKGEGLEPGSRVAVYATDGRMVGCAIVSENGSVEIGLGNDSGVFIVKSSSKTFKFIRK